MNAGKLNSYFGEGTVLKGTLKFKGLLRFDGQFEGEVLSPDTFIVGETGDVRANINAGEFFNYGAVTGDVEAKTKISLHTQSRLVGNINAPAIALEEGSFFEGSCKMPPPPPRSETPSKKSKSPKAEVAPGAVVTPDALGEESSFHLPMKKIVVGLVVVGLVAGGVWMSKEGPPGKVDRPAPEPTRVAEPIKTEVAEPSIDDLQAAVAEDPADEQAQLDLANVLIENEQLVMAIDALREATKALPKNDAILLALAETLQTAGREADALVEYKTYAKGHPDSHEAALNGAFDAMERGNLAAALKGYEDALDKNPTDLRARLGLATVYSKREENDKAVDECRKILDSRPDYAPALNRLAWLLAKQETNLKKAKELSEKSMAYYDDIPEYIDTLSEVNYRMGNYDAAVELIKKAVKLVPTDPYYKRQLFKFQRAVR